MISLAVIAYQLLFVGLMYLANRIGPKVGVIALLLALAWTVTHLFFPPLAVLQSVVIVGSWWFFRRARARRVLKSE